MTLFLISTGEYTCHFEDTPARIPCFVVMAPDAQHPLVQKAVDRLVNTTPYDRDEIVVQPLGEPVDHSTPTIEELTDMGCDSMM